MVTIIKGRDAIWDTDKYDVVLVGTSVYNTMCNGFQGKIAMKYPFVDEYNDLMPYGDKRNLGKRLTLEVKPVISLLYICGFTRNRHVSIDYDALEKCLVSANEEFKGKRVMTTLLGTSKYDGRGDRDRVMEIINRCCTDMDLYVYDYVQYPKKEEIEVIFKKMWQLKDKDPEKFREMWTNKWDVVAKMYLSITDSRKSAEYCDRKRVKRFGAAMRMHEARKSGLAPKCQQKGKQQK